MGKNCCQNKDSELEILRERQSALLKIVLLINAIMFVIEMTAGVYASSNALKADSLDMLGDALVYGFSLYVLSRSALWKAKASLLKGLIMAAFGLAVTVETVLKIISPHIPNASTMGSIGFLVLLANGVCLFLLTRHKDDDLNMKSVWLCSRNDIIANTGVLIAAYSVYITQSFWPDLIVGSIIAILFLSSSIEVIKESQAEIKMASA